MNDEEFGCGLLKRVLDFMRSVDDMEEFVNSADEELLCKMADTAILCYEYFGNAPEGEFKDDLDKFLNLVEKRLEAVV